MKIFNRLFNKKNAQTSADLLELLSPWVDAESGVSITPQNAMQISTVFSCVKVLAESVGMLPLNLFEVTGTSREKATDHALHALFRFGPNDYMTAQEYKELIMVHLALRGNHYSFINKVNGRIHELLPLNPDAVIPRISNDWGVTYTVTFSNGEVKELAQADILHIRLQTLDGLTGLSPIQWAKNTLGLAKATENHGSRLFKNGARPSGGFKTSATLKDDQFKRLQERLELVSGESQLKPFILEGGLEWVNVAMSNEDAQFLETRKYQRSEICGIFRVPPHMIADLEKATFSNIEHQGLSYVQHTLMPYLTRMEERFSKSLLSPSEQKKYTPKFNATALLRGDMTARSAYYTQQIQNGVLSPNEIRALEDMNPRDGGDIYLTPLNMAVNGKPQETQTNEQ